MKFIKYSLSFLCIFISIVLTLIFSFKLAVFYNYQNYFKNQYKKYEVEDRLNINMNDIMKVTDKLINYLKNNDDNLLIEVQINGEMKSFFTEQEIVHMNDVKNIFLKIDIISYCLIGLLIFIIISLIVYKVDWVNIFPKVYFINFMIFVFLTTVLIIVINIDFQSFFYQFHKLIFNNNLWLFNYNTSRVIKMFPQEFFFDLVGKIIFIFLVFLIFYTLFFLRWLAIIKSKK